MTFRPRDLFLVLATAAPLVGVVVLWATARRGEGLDPIRRLVAARRFDEAQTPLDAFLQTHPGDSEAHLLRAWVAVNRTRPEPALALEHLRLVRPDGLGAAVQVKVCEGFAYQRQARYDRAEAAWEEALRLDAKAPEAGWGLLALYDLQGRAAAAHRLGLRLHEAEPDPRDRVRLLLELARQDVQYVAPGSVIALFGPLHDQAPDDLPLALSVGRALVRDSRADEGLAVLRDALARHPDDPSAWDALLGACDDASRYDTLADEWRRLPPTLAASPRFARHQARVAQETGDWHEAARAYRQAVAADPADKTTVYRLARALRALGDEQGYEHYERRFHDMETAARELARVYETAKATKTLGDGPHPLVYHRLAELCERLGRPDEALAWHREVLRDLPNDPESQAARARLLKQ